MASSISGFTQNVVKKVSVTSKLLFVGFLVLIMLIPVQIVMTLVDERKDRQEEAATEVSDKWGGAQKVVGPILVLPYRNNVLTNANGETLNVNNQVTTYKETTVKETRVETTHSNSSEAQEPVMAGVLTKGMLVQESYIYLLPDSLDVQATINPEMRNRGIYQVALYQAPTTLDAMFDLSSIKELGIEENRIDYSKARIIMAVSDLKGLQKDLTITRDGVSLKVEPGTQESGNYSLENGVHALLNPATGNFLAASSGNPNQFKIQVKFILQGYDSLQVAPLGNNTTVKMVSSWVDPSFLGSTLPSERTMNESGFDATWNLSHLSRNYPKQWTATDGKNYLSSVEDSLFGVSLISPVDAYQKINRAIKYAILFVGLTFVSFFLFEVLGGFKIHPIQYLLVGLALAIFYLLLLSISEYLQFAWSYLIAALATIGLISVYSISILKAKTKALLITFLLIALYVYLYVLIHLVDYALLIGSIGLFVILAVVMAVTKNINWYKLEEKEPR